MKIGTAIRNMGPASTAEIIRHCAEGAEAVGLAHIWTVDHIAIPPDDAEGSDGRWLDPLATLAYLAAMTTRVDLGVSVLVLPYRPALPTAKWVASIQELSGGRLHLGIGPGWMDAEYKALGIDRRKRGAMTDEVIDVIRDCFDAPDDVTHLNGQEFLFRPSPPRPPIYVGGMTDAALKRTIRCGDGWIPIGIDPEPLRPRLELLKELADEAGKPMPEIVLLGSLPDEQEKAVEMLGGCREQGAGHYIQASRYSTEAEFDAVLSRLEDLQRQLG